MRPYVTCSVGRHGGGKGKTIDGSIVDTMEFRRRESKKHENNEETVAGGGSNFPDAIIQGP